MKIVHIIGGLGNQMFQYAFLIALREKFKQPILADISSFKGYNLHNGFELSDVFGIYPEFATKDDLRKLTYYASSYKMQRFIRKLLPRKKTECIESKNGDYMDNIFTDYRDLYYEGYWQNYKYFDDYYNIIQNTFSFKIQHISNANLNLVNLINQDSSIWVSIHIRRGDYIKHKKLGGICDLNYYHSAIKKIKQYHINKKLCFLILSNDSDWCKENLKSIIGDNICKFADWNTGKDSYIDMYLMTLCQSNIIANSSFSWWGAYLNPHKDKIVIAPKQWTNSTIVCERQLPDWILI